MRITTLSLSAALLAAALAGCDDQAVVGGTGGEGGGAGGANGDCAPDQRVDGFGNCLDVCLDEADCDELHWCHELTGLCLPHNTGDCDPADCPPGFVCPASGDGPCVAATGYCETTLDCPFGQRCEGDRCVSTDNDVVQTCTVDAECALAMSCSFGVCTGCLDDIQCIGWNAEAQCVMSTCVVTGGAGGCLRTGCGDGLRCNPVSGLCEEACRDDGDCAVTETCAPVLNQCVTDPSCDEDSDCPGEQTCSNGFGWDRGVCIGCNEDNPCDEGLTCVLGACLPDMSTDGCIDVTCEPGYLCDPADGSCYPEDGGCDTNADCRFAQVCNFVGFCSGCSGDNDCRPAQQCIFSTCIPTGG